MIGTSPVRGADLAAGERRDRRAVAIATLISLTLGFLFLFVRSPLPWGWEGIDHYHARALSIARGDGFPTMDTPAGYALFLAGFYRAFGDRPVVPLTVQVLLNALVPWMMYRLVRIAVDRRTATLTAVLVALFSFNTAYASTQAADAVCNVLFVAGMLALTIGCARDRLGSLALAGLLLGIAPQLRPNLILFPPVAAALVLLRPPRRARRFGQALAVALVAVATALPWTIRNYQLTGEVIPASTHGAVQLWYGSLQVGPYLNNRVYNPRALYEEWPFQYSSIADRPIVVTVRAGACGKPELSDVTLTWRSERDAHHTRASAVSKSPAAWTFELPGQPAPTSVDYEVSWTAPPRACPEPGRRAGVFFITHDLLGDPDRHGQLLDVFDVARLAAHQAFGDTVPFPDRLDANSNGVIDDIDLRAAVASLLSGRQPLGVEPLAIASSVSARGDRAVVRFVDGSTLTVPRGFTGRYTDLEATWKFGQLLMQRVRPMAELRTGPIAPPGIDVDVNRVFYRQDPHDMHRYTALALDNIRRDPLAFASASLYRAYRVFVVDGGIDVYSSEQFRGSEVVYAVAHAASLAYLLLFLAGLTVTLWRRSVPLMLLAPPVYVAVTIAPVLTNMRYSIATQPFVLAFAAIALLAAVDAVRRRTAKAIG